MVKGIAWVQSRIRSSGSSTVDRQSETEHFASLFECTECDTTYICEEMESCPECNNDVDHVPNERELGLI